MKVFLEKQFVKWWWLTMFILAIIVIIFGTAFYATENAEEETAVIVSIICLLIAIPLIFSLLYLRLETRIDEKGILTYFRPFGFTKKFYAWEDIKECYIRTYSPVAEFGGWGYRGLGDRSKAYNIWGNQGIQIITKDEKKFLIGTQKPEDAKSTINTYKPGKTNEV